MSQTRLPNYCTISELSPLLDLHQINFINLQYADFQDDLKEVKNKYGVTIHNFDDLDHFNDIDDVAALCSALDFVVSIKNTIPLISAGVGTTTMLANWRQSSWNNVLNNPLTQPVNIYEKNRWDPWNDTISRIAEDIGKLKEQIH